MNHPRSSRPRRGGPIGAAAFIALIIVGMSGCFTGERPTLAHEPYDGFSHHDDAVVDRVNALGDAVYTADYDVVTMINDTTTLVRASKSETVAAR